MKNTKLVFWFLLLLVSNIAFSQDAEDCKDPAMFPNRMTNFLITECKTNFDAVEFNLARGGANKISREGTKTFIHYQFNGEQGKSKPSVLQILRNYEAAVKKIGGVTVIVQADETFATFKILKSGREAVWIKIETGGDDNNDFYELTILQLEEMQQEVTSNDILTALNTDGRIALYINFDSGKSVVKSESEKTIEQIAEMLKTNTALKVSIEGHTDNVGVAASNLTLSQNRAKAVMNAIIAKGIDKGRLISKGWGQTKPVADNTTEDGRANNRRVEIVKQ